MSVAREISPAAQKSQSREAEHPGEEIPALVEAAALRLLHDENTEHNPLVNDGNAEKCVERLFPNIG